MRNNTTDRIRTHALSKLIRPIVDRAPAQTNTSRPHDQTRDDSRVENTTYQQPALPPGAHPNAEGGGEQPPAAVAPPKALRARRRRPAVIVLSIALIAAGALSGAVLYQRTGQRDAVLALARDVPFGKKIAASDLTRARISLDPALNPLGAESYDKAVGMRATANLKAGSLLTKKSVTDTPVLRSDERVVPVSAKHGQLPATSLHPGQRIIVVATPDETNGGDSAKSETTPDVPDTPGSADNSGADGSGADGSGGNNSAANNNPTDSSPANNNPTNNNPTDSSPANNNPTNNNPTDARPANNNPTNTNPTVAVRAGAHRVTWAAAPVKTSDKDSYEATVVRVGKPDVQGNRVVDVATNPANAAKLAKVVADGKFVVTLAARGD